MTPAGRSIAAVEERRVQSGKAPLNRRERAFFYLLLSRGLEPRYSAASKATGVDRGTIADTARGLREPTLGTLSALAIGLKVERVILDRIFATPVEDAEPTDPSESGDDR
jgi:transcriptional regulator with XRE-family HTH domain